MAEDTIISEETYNRLSSMTVNEIVAELTPLLDKFGKTPSWGQSSDKSSFDIKPYVALATDYHGINPIGGTLSR